MIQQTFGDYDEVPTIETEDNSNESAPPLPPPRITSQRPTQPQVRNGQDDLFNRIFLKKFSTKCRFLFEISFCSLETTAKCPGK